MITAARFFIKRRRYSGRVTAECTSVKQIKRFNRLNKPYYVISPVWKYEYNSEFYEITGNEIDERIFDHNIHEGIRCEGRVDPESPEKIIFDQDIFQLRLTLLSGAFCLVLGLAAIVINIVI